MGMGANVLDNAPVHPVSTAWHIRKVLVPFPRSSMYLRLLAPYHSPSDENVVSRIYSGRFLVYRRGQQKLRTVQVLRSRLTLPLYPRGYTLMWSCFLTSALLHATPRTPGGTHVYRPQLLLNYICFIPLVYCRSTYGGPLRATVKLLTPVHSVSRAGYRRCTPRP